MSDGAVNGLGFLGVRVDDFARFTAAVSHYRDTLGLVPFRYEPGRLAWFHLGDGTELHLYGPEDRDYLAFGDRPCVVLVVEDVEATRRKMERAGIEFLWETQRDASRVGPTIAARTEVSASCSVPARRRQVLAARDRAHAAVQDRLDVGSGASDWVTSVTAAYSVRWRND